MACDHELASEWVHCNGKTPAIVNFGPWNYSWTSLLAYFKPSRLCTSRSKPGPPPHPRTCGALVGLYHDIGSSLSPQYVGDLRVFLLLSWGMWGISRGFVLIQDGGDHSHKDFWEYFSTLERTQVYTGICGIRRIVRQIYTSINLWHGFKKANALILRCRWFFVPLLRKDNFSECFNT